MLTRHGILRERFADTLTDALRASLMRLAGIPRRGDAVRREQAHAPQHDAAGGADGCPREGRRSPQGVRRPGRDLVRAPAPRRAARPHNRQGRPDAGAGRARSWSCCRSWSGTAAAPPPDEGRVVFRFQDPAIVEASGLVVQDGLFLTTNDSGDTGRVFAVDPDTGRTTGVTTWASEPQDVEALAPAGGGEVWVGDIGDNARGARLDPGHPRPGRRGGSGRVRDVVRPGPSRPGPGRGVPAQPPGDRPAVRGDQGDLRCGTVRRADRAVAGPPEPDETGRPDAHVRDRRRLLPGREAPGHPQLRPGRRLHVSRPRTGRPRCRSPTSSRARRSRCRRTTASS